MKEYLEGSQAIAKVVALCRPGVISAYPITPQTHIVEGLAQLVADGELKVEFVNVESEHSAASCCLGALATGVRAYTSTSSQGLLLMAEVIFNIAGLRLPLVLTCANRAVSAPINIWNDHQDSVTVRDSGWIQFYAESIQEAADLHIQGYRLSEDKRVLLPVMINIDGYILTHGYEVVDIPAQELVDKFLPPYQLERKLDPTHPLTLGVLAGPDYYMETRFAIEKTMEDVLSIIPEISNEFHRTFGRNTGGLIEKYCLEDAQRVIVAMGSVCGTIKETIDEIREKGEKVGLLKIITYRPLPQEEIYQALKKVKEIAVLEKAISLGGFGPLYTEIKSLFQGKGENPKISGFIVGLGGRDITKNSIKTVFDKLSGKQTDCEFIDLKNVEIR
ncbi:MAG: pyruvate ferredoxin oxidoreductase [Candidatus Omnitrophica bacterium]|nr:pyruvate ferredoxin oxidoreductase [Candidatus Omnitrophota bacterium]